MLDHRAAEVHLTDHDVGLVPIEGAGRHAPQVKRARFQRAVLEHVADAVDAERGDDDPDRVVVLVVHVGCARWVDRDHDPLPLRGGGIGAPLLERLLGPQRVRIRLGEHAIEEALAQRSGSALSVAM
jgi:hypothetical protein